MICLTKNNYFPQYQRAHPIFLKKPLISLNLLPEDLLHRVLGWTETQIDPMPWNVLERIWAPCVAAPFTLFATNGFAELSEPVAVGLSKASLLWGFRRFFIPRLEKIHCSSRGFRRQLVPAVAHAHPSPKCSLQARLFWGPRGPRSQGNHGNHRILGQNFHILTHIHVIYVIYVLISILIQLDIHFDFWFEICWYFSQTMGIQPRKYSL